MRKNTLPDEKDFFHEPSVSALLKALDDGKRGIWSTGLKGSSKSFITCLLKRRLHRTSVIITPTLKEAQVFLNDIRFFFLEHNAGHSQEKSECLLYPPWDTLPFDALSPSPDVISKRLEVLYSLLMGRQPLIVTTVSALMQKVIPKDILEDSVEYIYSGFEIDRNRLIKKMSAGGFTRIGIVEEMGDFSVRGGIFDFFPPLLENPVRVEFFGDQIESIREFDITSQRSLRHLEEVIVLPVREVILNPATTSYAIKRIRNKANENNLPRSMRDEITEQIRNIGDFPGIDFLLPLFYPQPNIFFDYLPQDTLLFLSEQWEMENERCRYEEEIREGYQRSLKEKGLLSDELYLAPHEMDSNLDRFQTVFMQKLDIEEPLETHIEFHTEDNRDLRKEYSPIRSHEGILGAFVEKIKIWLDDEYHIFMICHTNSQAERLFELLEGYDLPVGIKLEPFLQSERTRIYLPGSAPGISIQVGDLLSGFRWPLARVVIITEEEIFGARKRRRQRAKPKENWGMSAFGDLETGDQIVHIDHGVGIYLGLKKLILDGLENDYLLLEYLDGDKLYLPVTRLNLLQKYMGVKDQTPKLDKLGGHSWETKKRKVKESVKKMAKELLKLYALRNVQKGFAFSKKDHYFRAFEATFQYEETPDQMEAIESTIRDMENEKPMDRLICGDVGFGKTEVAIRAAFKAVMDGKQVAVLVPTTILAYQHFQTLTERLGPYPVFIDMLSRFKTRQEQKTVINKLKDGEIDIVIGTHRLLQKDVVFKNLGLLVIDEEHRFGVSHKEKLKKLKKLVDVITMTATPIPRTLNLSMMGMRDLSVINTPPEDRLAIKTRVAPFDDNIIKRSILREIQRQGQVFFVHNRVKSISAMEKYLEILVPEARIGIAHGQMAEKDLEKVMLSFLRKEINLLLCTTIIESGLDFPSANTIVINRADKLGLAQIYQLRGRVGRAKEQAYAYLLVPGKHLVSKSAMKRLKALSELSQLGSGFRLAAHDLEIRGTGNILGTSQSGHIATVGYDMYVKLMDRTIKELKGEEITKEIHPEINLKIPATIPEDYINNTNQRLLVYKRLASVNSEEEAEEMRREITDRYGRIPTSVENLMEIVAVRNLLKRFLITRMDYNGKDIILSFDSSAEASLQRILQLIDSDRKKFRFSPDLKFSIAFNDNNWKNILNEVKNVLK